MFRFVSNDVFQYFRPTEKLQLPWDKNANLEILSFLIGLDISC